MNGTEEPEAPITVDAYQDKLVRLYRSCTKEPLEGYIVAVGREWLVVSVNDDSASMDGFSVVRTKDVVRVEPRGPADEFVRRSLTLRQEWPPAKPSWPIQVDSTAEMLRGIVSHAKVVSIFIEHEDPDVMFVGVPFWYRDDALGLTEINASGQWEEGESEWEFDRISRLEFDNLYLNRVLEVADHQE